SGPIIKDHLFFYGLGQIRDNESRSASITGGSLAVDKTDSPFFGIKLDGLITDRQRLEFTLFDTTRETRRDSYSYSNATGKDVIGSTIVDQTKFQAGGKSYVGKYTGTFTDWLTVSAAYGVTKDRDNVIPKLATASYVADVRSGTSKRISQQTSGSNDFPQNTKREFFRGDADLYFKLLGDHHIRTGYEEEKLSLQHITSRTGGKAVFIRKGSARDTRGVAAGQDYVEFNYYKTGGLFEGNNKAMYVQDSWDINNRLTVNLGVRRDQFSNKNAAGATFVEFNNEIAPRVGVTYDVLGDKTTKVYANYGRYYLPVAANTTYRQGAAELYFKEFYNAPAGGFVIDAI
ncbi:MAG: TonB-dependent receptor, partial [Caulobacteraceae bacterium]|nr:TonB-dependent receptor [Caulobacteraceae bacterium]